ncbi:MAG: hypothetical protein ABI371_04140 [Gelidibacter sp.]
MPRYDVFELVTHLRKCPDAYLKPSNLTHPDGLDSVALICDTYRVINLNFLQKEFKLPYANPLKWKKDNEWRAIHMSAWLLSHKVFLNISKPDEKLFMFWFKDLSDASDYVEADQWINDEERAEEMVRLLLNRCEIIPYGESHEEAADKLSSVSSAERHKVLTQSYEAHERIMQIKREMAEKKAREAANTYGRE